ncbi:aspartyl protease [Ceratobasidium sp. AG-Ba]|nr:aspartyl protease [Ceratobasidium sp. AG-Ba]
MRRAALGGLSLAIAASAESFTIRKVNRETSVRGSSKYFASQLATGDAVIKNDQAQDYVIEVSFGGKAATLVLDTGSSDLWLAPLPSVNYNQTFANAKIYNNLPANLTYGTGSAAGYVAQLDNIGFAGYTVNNQSLLYVTKQDDIFDEIEAQDSSFGGIVGVGFDTNSEIATLVSNATHENWGRSVLSNIFLENPTLPHYIAIFLDRLGYLNDTGSGTLDIGTYASGYEAVTSQPKHSVFSGYKGGFLQWNLLVSGLKINGESQTLQTGVTPGKKNGLSNTPPAGTISALLDTGTSLAQLPTAAWKALYEGMGGVLVKNQSYTQDTLSYAVPCMAEAQLEVTFGNQSVLVHPLDLTNVSIVTLPDGRNLTACLSYFQNGSWFGGDNDVILGDSFLRNVYAVYNYGDLTKTLSGFGGDPFIQLLPLTDASKASSEFKESRANALSFFPPEINISTINDPNPQAMSGSSASSGHSNSGPMIIALPGVLPAIFLVVISALLL